MNVPASENRASISATYLSYYQNQMFWVLYKYASLTYFLINVSTGFHSTCALLTLPRCQSSLSGLDGIQSPGRGQATVWPSVPPAATSSSYSQSSAVPLMDSTFSMRSDCTSDASPAILSHTNVSTIRGTLLSTVECNRQTPGQSTSCWEA